MKKKLIKILLAVVTVALAFSVAFGCNSPISGTLDKIVSQTGVEISGGGFAEGSVLKADSVEISSDEGKAALSAISGYEYNGFKPVYVFDISVVKDDVKVQPSGKVKVSVPVAADLATYRIVFHIKDSGVIEKLSATYADGKITFETDSFSIFVLAEPSLINHMHTFADEWSHDETNHWHAATCEHTAEKGDLAEHEWNKGEITTPATKDGDGVKTYTCTICGHQKTEAVHYHEHTFSGEWSQSETHHWHDCTAEDCDAVSEYEEHYYDPHAWWEIKKPATATEEGDMIRICIGCKYEDHHVIPKVDKDHKHTYSEEWASNEGYHWHNATCGHINEYGSEAEHTWDKGVITTPATDDDGVMTYTCTVCGRTKQEPIEHVHTFSDEWSKNETHHWHAATCPHTTEVDGKAEHTWNDGAITTPATEDGDGVKTYTCTVCGATKEEPYKYVAHTHTFSKSWSKDDDYHWHAATCEHKDEIADKAEHVWGSPSVIRLPSDIEGGLTIYKCTCGARKDVTTPHEHEYYSDWRYTDTEHWKLVRCSYDACKGLTSAQTAHEYVEGCCKDCGIKDPSSASVGLEFTLQEDGTYFVSGIGTCTDVHVVIPSTHEGKAVTGVSAEAFSRNSKLCSVYLPDSVKTVGDKAFLYCSGIHSVRLPDEMTYIGESAFTSNRLYTLTLPTKGLTEIKKDAFSYNQTLLSLYIPDNIKVIGDEAFNYCSNVTELRLPDSMEAFGVRSFAALKITSVDIPNGIKELPEQVFASCPLTAVYIPDGVETIGKRAFYYCSNITTVRFPESLTSIGMYAFDDCDGITSVTIPPKITELSEGVFANCSQLAEVVLPAGLTKIGVNAFNLCQKLTQINMPSGLTTLDGGAFKYTAITSIVIPEKVTAIGNLAFSNCKSLTSVTLPSGLRSIGKYAFEECTALEAISIPDGVTDILDGAFKYCTKLATVNLPTSLKELSSGAFSYTIITSVVVPDSVTEMGWSVFYYCEKLESVTFGSNSKLKTIGNGAFRGCTSLTTITLPSSVELIEEMAFAECENLTTVVIQSNVKNIEEDVFKDSNNVKLNEYDNAYYLGNSENPYYALIQVKDKTATSCTIHSSAYIIAARAFYQSAITEITIPDSVKIICAEAFKSCSSLKNAHFASIDDWCHVDDAETKTYYKLTDDYYAYRAYWKSSSATSETRVGCLGAYMFRVGALPGYTYRSDD